MLPSWHTSRVFPSTRTAEDWRLEAEDRRGERRARHAGEDPRRYPPRAEARRGGGARGVAGLRQAQARHAPQLRRDDDGDHREGHAPREADGEDGERHGRQERHGGLAQGSEAEDGCPCERVDELVKDYDKREKARKFET